jgi:hypothetical protein
VQDLLIDTYARFLRDATTTWFAAATEDRKFEDPDTRQLAAEALASETQVEFEAPTREVADAAKDLYDSVSHTRLLRNFQDERELFIKAAGSSLND